MVARAYPMTIELKDISARVWSKLTGRIFDGPVRVEVTRYPAPRLFAGHLLPAPWMREEARDPRRSTEHRHS
jgi:hypothetical protein